MKIAKRMDKVELINKFLEVKGLDKSLWYELCFFADFEYNYDVVLLQKIEEVDSEIKLLKQQSREIGAKLKTMRNNSNVDGWLYQLIHKKHKDVILSIRNSKHRKERLLKVVADMTNDANTGCFSKTYSVF